MSRTPIPPGVRWKVFARDGFRCRYCGVMAGDAVLVVDHQHPVALGGRNNFDNLISACEECNQGKSDTQIPSFPELHTYQRAASVAAGWLHMQWLMMCRQAGHDLPIGKSTLLLVVRDSMNYEDAIDTLHSVLNKWLEGYFNPDRESFPGITVSQGLVGYADWKLGWMDTDPDDDNYAAYVARYWNDDIPF